MNFNHDCLENKVQLDKKIYKSKVEKILEDRLKSISSSSPSVKIQIIGGNDCLHEGIRQTFRP